MPKTKPRLTPQIKVTIPKGQLAAISEAMEFDGATKVLEQALWLRQRGKPLLIIQERDFWDALN